MPPLTIEKITQSQFDSVLDRYPSTVKPDLHELDTLRYETIPAALPAYGPFKKDDVVKLVEWKLKHGKFRPKLLGLVQSNSDEEVEDVTRRALDIFLPRKANMRPPTFSEHMRKALPSMKILQELRGIGPATASLLLSAARPARIPFFSDELFRWTMWKQSAKGNQGWQRKIKYTVNEWTDVYREVDAVMRRLDVGAVECERVAYVLGREGIDVSQNVGTDNEESDGEVESTDDEESNEEARSTDEEESNEEAESTDEEDIESDPKQTMSQKARSETDRAGKGTSREDEANEERKKDSVAAPKNGLKRNGDAVSPLEGLRRSSRRKTSN